MRPIAIIVATLLLAAACSKKPSEPRPLPPGTLPPGVEAMSLLGQPLGSPPLAGDKRADREELVDEARKMPESADRAVSLGRRLAYMGRYQEAIAAFSNGLARYPNDPRLLRHRGHRYVNVRKFDLAKADLEKAAELVRGKPDEVEPDVEPKPKVAPVNSLQSSIWYHLGLAHYFTRDFGKAEQAWRQGLALADNPDKTASATYWLYLALRRLGRHDDAKKLLDPIDAKWQLVESGAYHKLLLAFRGDANPDAVLEAARKEAEPVPFPTVAYGICAWYSFEGNEKRADAIRREVVNGAMWPAFGFIASEVELAASRGTPESR